MKELEEYPCLSFDQGTNNSFYFAEEVLSTYEYKRLIKANDRATILNLQYFPVVRHKENFLRNFSQKFVKTAPCGVVGNERTFKRVWDTSQQAKSVRIEIRYNSLEKGRFSGYKKVISN